MGPESALGCSRSAFLRSCARAGEGRERQTRSPARKKGIRSNRSFTSFIYANLNGLLWLSMECLQISHQVMYVVIGVLAEEVDVSFDRRIHVVADAVCRPGAIAAAGIAKGNSA